MQQNSFDPVDNSVSVERQRHIFNLIFKILASEFDFQVKDEARKYFNQMRQLFLDYNGAGWDTEEFREKEKELFELIDSKQKGIEETAAAIMESTR
jgi:V/A-type H+-transporting ATPase subunit A